MGLAIARRLDAGRRVCIADSSNEVLSAAQDTLTDDGYMIKTFQVDVSDYASVSSFAQAAASQGPIEAVIHTAGLSPSAGSAQKSLKSTSSAPPTLLRHSWKWRSSERAWYA